MVFPYDDFHGHHASFVESGLTVGEDGVSGSEFSFGDPANLDGVVPVGWFDVFEGLTVTKDGVIADD